MATIAIKRQPVGSQVKLTIVMTFDSRDPLGVNIYDGITALVDHVMSSESADAFLGKLKAIRRNPKGGEVSGRITS